MDGTLSKSLILAHKRCIVEFFEANHRIEHGGLDLVNANFDSDRAYGNRSDSKGNRGHIDGLDGVRSALQSAISCHMHI